MSTVPWSFSSSCACKDGSSFSRCTTSVSCLSRLRQHASCIFMCNFPLLNRNPLLTKILQGIAARLLANAAHLTSTRIPFTDVRTSAQRPYQMRSKMVIYINMFLFRHPPTIAASPPSMYIVSCIHILPAQLKKKQ